MAGFAVNVLLALIAICVIVGLFWLVLWVLKFLGVPVPDMVVRIAGVILLLLILIWLIRVLFMGQPSGPPFGWY